MEEENMRVEKEELSKRRGKNMIMLQECNNVIFIAILVRNQSHPLFQQ